MRERLNMAFHAWTAAHPRLARLLGATALATPLVIGLIAAGNGAGFVLAAGAGVVLTVLVVLGIVSRVTGGGAPYTDRALPPELGSPTHGGGWFWGGDGGGGGGLGGVDGGGGGGGGGS